MTPLVSIVVPTFDAGAILDEVLTAVAAQECELPYDVIAIDSGSTDGTLARLQAHGARVLTVPAGTFNHGLTRNAALAHVRGDFAVLLVQDAVPASPQWLRALLTPLLEEPTVAGSFARQVPARGASSITSCHLSRWVAAGERPRAVGPLTRAAFESMSPAERHHTCAFDNVCSAVRMSVWRKHPFKQTPIGEDLEWARDVLLDGHRLAYAPDAVVRHSHERSVRYELQRTYLVHQRLQELFGLSTIPSVGALVRSVALTVPENVRVAATGDGAAREWLRGAALGVAMPLGQYLGARSAREGRELLRTVGV